jgi:hypothetical protein
MIHLTLSKGLKHFYDKATKKDKREGEWGGIVKIDPLILFVI